MSSVLLGEVIGLGLLDGLAPLPIAIALAMVLARRRFRVPIGFVIALAVGNAAIGITALEAGWVERLRNPDSVLTFLDHLLVGTVLIVAGVAAVVAPRVPSRLPALLPSGPLGAAALALGVCVISIPFATLYFEALTAIGSARVPALGYIVIYVACYTVPLWLFLIASTVPALARKLPRSNGRPPRLLVRAAGLVMIGGGIGLLSAL